MYTFHWAEMIQSLAIHVTILLPTFNIFNTIHFEEETNQTTEENKYGSQGKSHAAVLI